MYTRKAYATREAPRRGSGDNRKPVRDSAGALGWRRGFVYRAKPGNSSVEGRDSVQDRRNTLVKDLELGKPINLR